LENTDKRFVLSSSAIIQNSAVKSYDAVVARIVMQTLDSQALSLSSHHSSLSLSLPLSRLSLPLHNLT
ncbi:hypothetical protein ACTXT7_017268, partial [Hymenolepis weldensis]